MSRLSLAWGFALGLLLACALAMGAQAQSPSTVLVVANANSAESVDLARHYQAARRIPERNLLLAEWSADERADACSLSDYNRLSYAIRKAAEKIGGVDYIVLCRNLPVRIRETGGSFDSALAANSTKRTPNPYYYYGGPFDADRYGFRLVTRLDGWSWADAHALIDRAQAAQPGVPYADCAPGKTSYAERWLQEGAKTGVCERTAAFRAPSFPVGAYFSWGSNDPRFSRAEWLKIRFVPGGIVETFVSTSASHVRYPGGGQSQVAELLRQGATGVKGYVTEPTLSAVAQPPKLWKAYSSGRNLAESYYYASPFLGWKDVVIGDPLCAPYRK